MYNLTLKTAPVIEPLEFNEVKDYLKISYDDDDLYIISLITAARKYCENYQNRAYITQVLEMSLDYWPNCNQIELPKGSLQTVNSIKYKDSKGIVTTWDNSNYVYSSRGIKGRLAPAYGIIWPSFTPYPLDAIVIEFTCGYGDTADSVPEIVKQAMHLLISHWYENRIPLADKMTVPNELNFSVTALLWQEKIISL